MSAPPNELIYAHHAVAFLDLVGQQEKLRGIQDLLLNERPNRDLLFQTLKQTVGTIKSFRQLFDTYFSQYTNLKSSLNVRTLGIARVLDSQFS